MFDLLRDAIAGPVLCLLAYAFEGWRLQRGLADFLLFAVGGALLFTAQFFFVVAVKLASPVEAAAWQTATPVRARAIQGGQRATAQHATAQHALPPWSVVSAQFP